MINLPALSVVWYSPRFLHGIQNQYGGWCICFLCKDPCLLRDKIKVFGRSSSQISALIAWATKVDLSVYVASDREKAVICNSTCYKRLIKYQNAVRKMDAIIGEIQQDFHGHANKRIKLEDLLRSSSASPRKTLQRRTWGVLNTTKELMNTTSPQEKSTKHHHCNTYF